MQQISRTLSQQMETLIWTCSDKCSTDLFPNASYLKKSYENQNPRHDLQPMKMRIPTLTSHCRFVFTYTEVASCRASVLQARTSSQSDDTKCNSHSGPQRNGKPHSCQQQFVLRVRLVPIIFVNCDPMLTVGCL